LLEEIQVIDAVTYRDGGHIEVRRARVILKDGAEIARTYHRHVVSPGADVSNEDSRVQAIAEALWTPELIGAFKAVQEQSAL
jgi:hypothetical protein